MLKESECLPTPTTRFSKLIIFLSVRHDYPICDREGKVFALILGWPDGWELVWIRVEAAVERLQQALEGLKVPHNRRGDFIAYAMGFTYGGGPTVSPILSPANDVAEVRPTAPHQLCPHCTGARGPRGLLRRP